MKIFPEKKDLGLTIAKYGLWLLIIMFFITCILPFCWQIFIGVIIGVALAWIGMVLILAQEKAKRQKFICYLKEVSGKNVIIQSYIHPEIIRVIKQAKLLEKQRVSLEFEPYEGDVAFGYKVKNTTFPLGQVTFLQDGRLVIESQYQEDIDISDRYIFGH